jgi:hypothetical protein
VAATPVYHRFQDAETSKLMIETGKVGGRAGWHSDIPKVKAFLGPLPADRAGIEFTTDIVPDRGCPPGYAFWSAGGAGVEVLESNELVAIAVTITKVQFG